MGDDDKVDDREVTVTLDVTEKSDGSFTPNNCQSLPNASVDTILWGGGEGDQGTSTQFRVLWFHFHLILAF